MSKFRAPAPARNETRAARREETAVPKGHATRETIESVAVAVILAFLFRAFVAEAFVIPTGSMAPTLMGQHKDVECPECGAWYRAGASIEIDDQANSQGMLEGGRHPSKRAVVATTCPLCRYRKLLDLKDNANHLTFSGDRILVSKFIYDFTSPKRWDVIVFKYPFNAKQNFIKRLIGLPNETILIKRGDIFAKGSGASDAAFKIARKPDKKLEAVLQLVDDTRHISRRLVEIKWPTRWQAWDADGKRAAENWSTGDNGHTFQTEAIAGRDLWLRYHHIVPTPRDWEVIEAGQTPERLRERRGALITDYYAYNAFTSVDRLYLKRSDPDLDPADYGDPQVGSPSLSTYQALGLHWVGDLALESEIEIKSNQGELLLLLVKGGLSYLCRIDIDTGKATLSIDQGRGEFTGDDGKTASAPEGQTRIRGDGTYTIRYSNVDAQVRLWVDNRRVEFNGPTTYVPRDDLRPVTSDRDPGDLAPLGIGTHGAALHVQRLRVLRDIYYVATEEGWGPPHEYRNPYTYGVDQILTTLHDPSSWEKSPIFAARDELRYEIGPDQFFPMGDNSPQSSDARMWRSNYFERELLIGKALLIYWPHPWYRPIPYMPNFRRMRLIH